MRPKPEHLNPKFAEHFTDTSVVEAYRLRPPYPPEAFDILASLMRGNSRRILDAGCGSGKLALGMLDYCENVDAVDFSAAMIEEGGRAERGGDAKINWICAPAETAPLSGPYSLIICGQSLPWMDWGVVMPRFADALEDRAFLAYSSIEFEPYEWESELAPLRRKYSLHPRVEEFDFLAELAGRGLFEFVGETRTAPVVFSQAVADYIESFHSAAGFSRERMSAAAAAEFDRAVGALVEKHGGGDRLETGIRAHIVWGYPLGPRVL